MRDPRTLAALVGPVMLALAWTSYYAWLRDRAIWPKVYGGSFSTPLLSGLHFFLFSSGGGFFCYNPVLLLGLVGLWPLWRRDRACTALVLLLVVVRLFFYARWSDPAGGVVWGPRFLLPWTWLLAIPTALVLTAIWSWPRRRLAPALVACGGLAAASAMASWLSVWVPPEETYNHIHYVPPAVPAAARKAYLDRAVLLYYKSWQRGPFALSWADATKPRQLPLEHMRDGPSAVGYLAMLGATLVPAAAVALAGKPARPRLDS
jgi:hypothetical protein